MLFVQTALAINGLCSQILHSFYCKPVRAPLLASNSIARQHHQRHGHRPGTPGSVVSYPREEPSKERRRSGGLQGSFAINFWARQGDGAVYFRRGCCWAHTMSTSSSRTPESRVVFHDHRGLKRGVLLALTGVLELFFTFG
jgi:hypothetical protein